mmetsp:Transcript_18022/g.55170  ORF Transcript_18022/g.55170 Transcript_18022/m.55170 type:complete len:423 (-) Transcript_18022:716-1984(-)
MPRAHEVAVLTTERTAHGGAHLARVEHAAVLGNVAERDLADGGGRALRGDLELTVAPADDGVLLGEEYVGGSFPVVSPFAEALKLVGALLLGAPRVVDFALKGGALSCAEPEKMRIQRLQRTGRQLLGEIVVDGRRHGGAVPELCVREPVRVLRVVVVEAFVRVEDHSGRRDRPQQPRVHAVDGGPLEVGPVDLFEQLSRVEAWPPLVKSANVLVLVLREKLRFFLPVPDLGVRAAALPAVRLAAFRRSRLHFEVPRRGRRFLGVVIFRRLGGSFRRRTRNRALPTNMQRVAVGLEGGPALPLRARRQLEDVVVHLVFGAALSSHFSFRREHAVVRPTPQRVENGPAHAGVEHVVLTVPRRRVVRPGQPIAQCRFVVVDKRVSAAGLEGRHGDVHGLLLGVVRFRQELADQVVRSDAEPLVA